MNPLLTPMHIGPLHCPNRLVLAPMSRMRSDASGIPGALNAEYYAQRASAGLLISEATPISAQGVGYTNSPCLFSDEHLKGWQAVTNAVHARGGRIFMQMWHVGRISHSLLQRDGRLPVAPSPIAARGTIPTPAGPQPYEVPHALDVDEIAGIVQDYRRGAEMAMQAGFDGVEVQCANGYLLEQFLNDQTNVREDHYGGRVANRCRLLLEVLDAVTSVMDAQRVGVRLSPFGSSKDCFDSNPLATHTHLVRALDDLDLAYLHIYEPRAVGAGMWDTAHEDAPTVTGLFRTIFRRPIISTGGFNIGSGRAMIENGTADAIGFGRLFISNPDLPERIKTDHPLAGYDRDTFYSGGAKGYIDYPASTRR